MSNVILRDISGQPIRPHALFLYAAAMASSTYLYWGRVVAIKGTSITFQGIERWGGRNGPQLRERLSSMQSPEKVIVLSWSHPMPPNIRSLLDPIGEHAAALGETYVPTSAGIAT